MAVMNPIAIGLNRFADRRIQARKERLAEERLAKEDARQSAIDALNKRVTEAKLAEVERENVERPMTEAQKDFETAASYVTERGLPAETAFGLLQRKYSDLPPTVLNDLKGFETARAKTVTEAKELKEAGKSDVRVISPEQQLVSTEGNVLATGRPKPVSASPGAVLYVQNEDGSFAPVAYGAPRLSTLSPRQTLQSVATVDQGAGVEVRKEAEGAPGFMNQPEGSATLELPNKPGEKPTVAAPARPKTAAPRATTGTGGKGTAKEKKVSPIKLERQTKNITGDLDSLYQKTGNAQKSYIDYSNMILSDPTLSRQEKLFYQQKAQEWLGNMAASMTPTVPQQEETTSSTGRLGRMFGFGG